MSFWRGRLMDGTTIEVYTNAARSIRRAMKMLRELYPTVEREHREKLKEVDGFLLDGLGSFMTVVQEAIGVDGRPAKTSWSQEAYYWLGRRLAELTEREIGRASCRERGQISVVA